MGHVKLRHLRDIITAVRDILAPDLPLGFGTMPDPFITDYSRISTTTLLADCGVQADYPFDQAILETADFITSTDPDLAEQAYRGITPPH
ncbi:MAG: hypothetical protein IJ228_03755 [Succinivibrio sp.]|nr:hypothetical protein [Succinivibrio sp.]